MSTPKHGHSPIQMRLVDSLGDISNLGDFAWGGEPGKETIFIAIPDKTRRGWCTTVWTINHRNRLDAQWSWNGNKEKPTLAPSLHCVGMWHGWVRNGMLVEA